MSDVEPGGRVADYLPRITNVGGMEPLDRLLGSGPEAFAASCCSSAKMRVTFVASTGCRFVLGLPLVVINALSPIAGVKEDWTRPVARRTAQANIGDRDRRLALAGDAAAANSEVFRQFVGRTTRTAELGRP